jgi:hypothetical protein
MKSWNWLTGLVAAHVLLAGLSAGTHGSPLAAPQEPGKEPPGKFQPDWLEDPLYRVCAGLVSWWPADGHAFDLAGPYHGQPSGPIAFARGHSGMAFSFPAERALVSAGRPPELADTFTLALWVHPAAPRQLTPPHAHRYAGCQGQRYAIFPEFGGLEQKRAGCGFSVGTNGVGLFECTHDYLPCVLAHDAPIKGWTHLAVVYVKGVPTLYINGTAVKTGARSTWSVFPSTTFGDPTAASRYGPYLGEVDEPMVFNRALTEQEIMLVVRVSDNAPPGIPGRKPLPLSDAAFAELWSYLSGEQAPRALFAAHRLAASGDAAVRRLRSRLLPPVVPGAVTAEELIRRLDDRQFRERERALQALLRMGSDVVPELREQLKAKPSPEARARIELLLRRLATAKVSVEQVRAVRAITALGRIDTAASRALLGELAAGAATAPRTVAARAALLRLGAGEKAAEK